MDSGAMSVLGKITCVYYARSGEVMPREIKYNCVCHEEAEEVRDASERPGTSRVYMWKLFIELYLSLFAVCQNHITLKNRLKVKSGVIVMFCYSL